MCTMCTMCYSSEYNGHAQHSRNHLLVFLAPWRALEVSREGKYLGALLPGGEAVVGFVWHGIYLFTSFGGIFECDGYW